MEASMLRVLCKLPVMAGLVLVTACQFPAGQADPLSVTTAPLTTSSRQPLVQQLIIKFKPDTIACDAEGIARVASALPVKLMHVRAMSGQACVIRQMADTEGDLAKGQVLLRQHPDVEWLEPDAIMKHFK